MGSPPRESRCVGEMVSDGTVIAYKSVGIQCSGECSSSFQRQCQTQTDPIRTDNSTVVSYINPQGGTKFAVLWVMTWRILHWCRLWGVQLRAAHIPGKKECDSESVV